MTIAANQTILASDFVGPGAVYPTIEVTTGATHSLTTVANQRVIVFAKGNSAASGGGSPEDVTLAYNGVTKDTTTIHQASAPRIGFALMYTETPGAATHDITVNGTITNVKIIVIKF